MQAFYGSAPLKDSEKYRIAQLKVKALYAEIQQLHSYMNRLIPVSRLPEDILQLIFKILQEAESGSQYECDVEPDLSPSNWMSVTHVCKRWRVVALGAPLLWMQPLMSNICMTETMLARSKNAPLTIRAKIGDGRYGLKLSYSTVEIESLRACFSNPRHLERILSLSISNIDDILDGLWCIPALPINLPQLGSLRLVGRPDTSSSKLANPDLLIMPTRSLRKIEFSNVNVLWASPLFNNLTHLTLDRTIPNKSTDMFLMLERLAPRLLVLHLSNTFRLVPHDAQTPYHSSRIGFKRLNELTVHAEFSELVCFFLSISILPSTITHIRITYRLRYEYLLNLWSVLGCSYTPPLSTVPFKSLVVVKNHLNSNSLSLQFHRTAMETPLSKAQWTLYLENDKTLFPFPVEMIFRSLHTSGIFYMQLISHLHLSLPSADPHSLATSIFMLDGVTFLKLNGCTASYIAPEVLRGLAYRKSCPDGLRRFSLPLLNTIHFEDGDCVVEEIEDCLVKRAKDGLVVQQLSFLRCNVAEEEVAHLREITGGEVFWDEEHDTPYVSSEGDDTDTDEESDDDDDNYRSDNSDYTNGASQEYDVEHMDAVINEFREELQRKLKVL